MDTLQNLRAFVAVAQCGSFSAAARQFGLATSVMTKRIDQLEAQIRARLFVRTTRRLALTDVGKRWIERVQNVVGDVDDLLAQAISPPDEQEGLVRIKAPTSLAVLYVGEILRRFQALHPKVSLDIVLTDRALNPAHEGFDVAISVFDASFSGVIDVPLCLMQRTLCAAPAYLAQHGAPRHPRDLPQHDTLNFAPTGPVWTLFSALGPVSVEIRPKLSANDGQLLANAALAGDGIALLSNYIALPSLRSGALVPVLEGFTVPDRWIKALIPESRMKVARVKALLNFLASSFSPPPWEASLRMPLRGEA